jgi:hypothetical protein
MTTSPSTMFTVCCLCIALAMARPSLAAAPPTTAEPAPRTVHLKVDVDELGDRGIGLDKVIFDELGPQIAEAGFELVDEDAATVLLVRLRPLESSKYDYGLHFEFVEGGHRTPAVEWVDCHLCSDAKLIPALDARLPALILALDARAEELAAEATGDGDGGEGHEPDPEPKAITGLGIGGSVIAGLGIGTLIGGSIELSRGVVTESSGEQDRKRTDHRPPGYALVGVGATALVAGIVMLGVDLAAQSKKRKARTKGERTQVIPVLTPETIGIGVAGRF